jgi:glycosyltransferase involved in cell wall biosynthesis
MTGSSRPRVLQVVLSLNPGGTERLVLDLVMRINAEIPMSVCCIDEDGAWASQLRDIGVPVTSLRRIPGFQPKVGSEIHAVARRHDATVIHAHHYSPFVYSCLARARAPRTRLVFTEHGRVSDAPPSAKRRLANRVLSRFPTRVFTVSNDLREHIIAEGFSASQVEVIYNGIDVRPSAAPDARASVRARLGVDDHTLVAGTIARLDPVKDLGTLIRAVALAHRVRPWRLVIVGDGSERARLEQLAADLGAAGAVTFLGHRDDARDWLPGCDVFVNSSISEGVSLTILEAMAASLPVVATRVGGTPEVVTPDCGVLVPAGQAQQLADALLHLGGDAPLRAALGTAARARVEAMFSLDRMVRQYRDVYRGVA